MTPSLQPAAAASGSELIAQATRAVRLCLPRMVTSDERKKVSGGASLHTPLTRRASGGQG